MHGGATERPIATAKTFSGTIKKLPLQNLSNVMPDYVQGRTGDNAAVAFRSVMLRLLSDIIPAFRAKPCHFNLKLFSVHIFYHQGNYLFIKSSLQGSCFSYLNCLPLPSLSCSLWKQSWFSRACFAFFFSLPVMIWSALVLYSWEGRVKSSFQTGFSNLPWDALQKGWTPNRTWTHCCTPATFRDAIWT